MVDEPHSPLVRLGDTDLTVASPAEDVRGRKVLDRNGNHVGNVDGVLIDESERKVRFLEVGSGGFLGLGKKKRLVPVDAVTAIDDDVHIDTSQETVGESPDYAPDLVPDVPRQETIFQHYGYAPYSGPGYVYPPYPYR